MRIQARVNDECGAAVDSQRTEKPIRTKTTKPMTRYKGTYEFRCLEEGCNKEMEVLAQSRTHARIVVRKLGWEPSNDVASGALCADHSGGD